jgi:hypothetical protein
VDKDLLLGQLHIIEYVVPMICLKEDEKCTLKRRGFVMKNIVSSFCYERIITVPKFCIGPKKGVKRKGLDYYNE